jgi:hypothetical protein
MPRIARHRRLTAMYVEATAVCMDRGADEKNTIKNTNTTNSSNTMPGSHSIRGIQKHIDKKKSNDNAVSLFGECAVACGVCGSLWSVR